MYFHSRKISEFPFHFFAETPSVLQLPGIDFFFTLVHPKLFPFLFISLLPSLPMSPPHPSNIRRFTLWDTYASAPCSTTSQHSFRETKLLLDVKVYKRRSVRCDGGLDRLLTLELNGRFAQARPCCLCSTQTLWQKQFCDVYKTIRADPECQP